MNKKCTEDGFIREKLDNVISGINIYKKIWRKYHRIRNRAGTCVLIFPEQDKETEKYTLEKIEQYLKQRKYKHFILVGRTDFSEELKGLSSCVGSEIITEREMSLLLESFNFCMFALNAVVVSLDLPYGRKASNILSFGKITAEDVIKNGVFGFKDDPFNISAVIFFKLKIKLFLKMLIELFAMLTSEGFVGFHYKYVIAKGRAVYEKFLPEYQEHFMFPAPYAGTGDVYMAAMILKNYARTRNIDKYFVPVVGRSNVKICALFGLQAVPLDKPDMDNLIRYLSFAGISECQAELLHHDPMSISIGILDRMRNIKGLDFLSMYLCGVFNTNDRSIISLPEFDGDTAATDKLFSENDLVKGKTVMLAPYNYTLPKMKKAFWEKLAESLLKKGYTVCTNCCGNKEVPVKGTVPVFCPYSQIVPFLEQAGGIVAIRSGLCEVISSARCKKIILYLEGFPWNGKDNIDYFSLNKMGLCDDACEFTYKNNKSQLSLADKISDMFE